MTVPPRDRDPAPGDRPRLLELLAALSVATDLGMGQPAETALRSSVLAMGLARALELPDDDVRTAGVGTLLRHIGYTVTAAAEARLYGDELESRRAAQPADFGDRREMLALTLASTRGTGARRPWRAARTIVEGRRRGRDIVLSVCDAASVLASRLRLGPRVEATCRSSSSDGTAPVLWASRGRTSRCLPASWRWRRRQSCSRPVAPTRCATWSASVPAHGSTPTSPTSSGAPDGYCCATWRAPIHDGRSSIGSRVRSRTSRRPTSIASPGASPTSST